MRPVTSILETQQEQNRYFARHYPNRFERVIAMAKDMRQKTAIECEERERAKQLKRYNPNLTNPVQVRRIIID